MAQNKPSSGDRVVLRFFVRKGDKNPKSDSIQLLRMLSTGDLYVLLAQEQQLQPSVPDTHKSLQWNALSVIGRRKLANVPRQNAFSLVPPLFARLLGVSGARSAVSFKMATHLARTWAP